MRTLLSLLAGLAVVAAFGTLYHPGSFAAVLAEPAMSPHVDTAPAPRVPPEDSAGSFRRAADALNRAVSSAGGADNLGRLARLRITLEGTSANAVQGHDPADVDSPKTDGRFVALNRFDETTGRYFQETRQDVSGGLHLRLATLVRDGALHALAYESKRFTRVTGPAAAPDALVQTTARFVPGLVLRRALEHRASLRHDGEAGSGADRADLVSLSWDARTRFTVALRQSDGRMLWLTAVGPDPLDGDGVSTYRYSDYEAFGDVVQPRHIMLERRGAVTLDLRVTEVAVGAGAVVESDFQLPTGFTEAPPPTPAVRKVAEGLYEVSGLGGGLYRTQFVDGSDGVVVFDAPLGYPAAQQVVRLIEKTLPGRPIVAVVISHFHADHAGGVQALADAGAEVVTTRSARPVLERYAKAQSALLVARPPTREARYRLVEETPLTLGRSAGRRVVVHRLTTPHVSEMLVLVDPTTATVVQGDLYSDLSSFNQTFAQFGEWLARRRSEISRVLGTHHEETSAASLIDLAEQYRRRPAAPQVRSNGS